MTKFNWNSIKTLRDNQDYHECLSVPTRFLTGTYQGKNIGSIIKAHPDYIVWILDNQPKGKLAFQIIEYCNRYPDAI